MNTNAYRALARAPDPRDLPLDFTLDASDLRKAALVRTAIFDQRGLQHRRGRVQLTEIPLMHTSALSPAGALRAAHLQNEMQVLGQARDCATAGATSEVIHGRIDTLIEERRTELAAIFQREQGEALDQLNARG